MKNQIYFENNWGLFIGSFVDNLPHKHYAVQLSIGLKSAIFINEENGVITEFENCLIQSNVSHQLSCDTEHLLILLNPTSSTGHLLNQFSEKKVTEFSFSIAEKLRQSSLRFLERESEFKTAVSEVRDLLKVFACECEEGNHFEDERVRAAVIYMEKNFDRVIPLKEIAEQCFLSESRFLHLFKEKTGITYRKSQQWNKVSRSFAMLRKQSLTETAHQLGFADSAHFSKVFKETFGFTPKRIQQR